MKLPKYNLLYFKALFDKCLIKFFDQHNDDFANVSGNYVLADNLNKAQLKVIFKTYLKEELLQYVRPYSIVSPDYFLIIGACQPKDNLLLNYKDGYFPDKLSRLINSDFWIKYVLKEKDIKLDLVKFNQTASEIFQELFKSHDKVLRFLGKEYKNVFFIQHSKLDCYSMFKTIKYIFGKSNCWNIHKEKFYNQKTCLVAVNDLIDRYIHNKLEMNKSAEFRQIVQEVKQFLDELIQKEILNGR